jgi:hypothetical protein
MAEIQSSEPQRFSAGDSLYFIRDLPQYPAESGWYLQYELLTLTGAPVVEFRSVPQNDLHLVEIDNFAETFDTTVPYILAGYAVNPAGAGGGAERHQIYSGRLVLTPDLASGATAPDETPFELKMVRTWECTVQKLAATYVNESDIAGVRLMRIKQKEASDQLFTWQEKYNHLKKVQDARNGRPDPSLVRPVFAIC